jgi:hypothetical protein
MPSENHYDPSAKIFSYPINLLCNFGNWVYAHAPLGEEIDIANHYNSQGLLKLIKEGSDSSDPDKFRMIRAAKKTLKKKDPKKYKELK